VPLEQLWAGWRYDYVRGATEQEREHGEAGAGVECVFCRIAGEGDPSVDNLIVWRGPSSLAVLNLYPYGSGHLLVLPVRHVGDLSELAPDESVALWETTQHAIDAVNAAYDPDGINMGANLGRAAGAGIPAHLHLHVVPRWSGDTNFMSAVAGVRVIPEPLSVAWEKISAAWPA
jgi:ATP adenylyltransferase